MLLKVFVVWDFRINQLLMRLENSSGGFLKHSADKSGNFAFDFTQLAHVRARVLLAVFWFPLCKH